MSLQLKYKTGLVLKLVNEFERKKVQLTRDLLMRVVQIFAMDDISLSQKNLALMKEKMAKDWIQTLFSGSDVLDESDQRSAKTLIELMGKGPNQNVLNKISATDNFVEKLRNFFYFKTKESSKLIKSFNISDIKSWHKNEFNRSSTEKLETLAVIVRGFELITTYPLRNTQILSVLLFCKTNEPLFLQIGTGEGKTWLIIAFAIMKVLYGEKVDIITSSNLLASRDAFDKINIKIYDLFGVSVGENCNEDDENRKSTYATKDVIYGSLSNFQRDYLLDKFYGKNITAGRKHQTVIVDEVDSMLLDKGNLLVGISS
jgi:golgin subfamily B member 1